MLLSVFSLVFSFFLNPSFFQSFSFFLKKWNFCLLLSRKSLIPLSSLNIFLLLYFPIFSTVSSHAFIIAFSLNFIFCSSFFIKYFDIPRFTPSILEIYWFFSTPFLSLHSSISIQHLIIIHIKFDLSNKYTDFHSLFEIFLPNCLYFSMLYCY